MAHVNTNGDLVCEDMLVGYGMVFSSLTDGERDTILALICGRLNVQVMRTNATKHGTTELVLRSSED